MMKKGLNLACVMALSVSPLLLSSCNSGPGKVELKNEDQKTLYALGRMVGQRTLPAIKLSEEEARALGAGLADQAAGKEESVNLEEYSPKVQEFIKKRLEGENEKHAKEGTAYIEKFLKEEGAKKTESGLAYKIIAAGDESAKPSETDEVEVHYHGTLIDGKVFDSSVERGKTISFPLDRVIPGWTEGLQLIGKGGKIKLVIPSNLGYGDRGAPPKIPGGSTLIFDVELFNIKKADAPAAPAKK